MTIPIRRSATRVRRVSLMTGSLLLLSATPPLFAAGYQWTGNTNALWNNSNNWTPNVSGGPLDTDDIIGTTTTATLSPNGARTIRNLTNNATDIWTIQGMRTDGNTLTVTGTLAQSSSGTLRLRQGNNSNQTLSVEAENIEVTAGNLELGQHDVLNGASLNALNVGNRTLVTGGTLSVNTSSASYRLGSLDVSGGIVTLNARQNQTLIAEISDLSGAGAGVLQASYGTRTGRATLRISSTIDTTASLTLIDGGASGASLRVEKSGAGQQTFAGANQYSGGTFITEGTLRTASTTALGSGEVALQGSGKLNSGTARLELNALSITEQGELRLNDERAGTLYLFGSGGFSMDSGRLYFDLTETDHDQVIGVTGSIFTITGGTLDLNGSVGDYGQHYALFSGFDAGLVEGLSITGYDTTRYDATLSTDGSLSFTTIPEPASAYLVLIAFTALFRNRRR